MQAQRKTNNEDQSYVGENRLITLLKNMPKNRHGFSLVELMTVVVIIGILSAVAIPSYNQYTLRAKIAEAYTGMDNVKKLELTYFSENRHFLVGVVLPNDVSVYPPYTLSSCTGCGWDVFGYPFPIPSSTYFKYLVFGASVDQTGSGYLTSVDGETFGAPNLADMIIFNFATRCNPSLSLSDLGISSTPNSHFLVVAAGSNFKDPGDVCTLVIQTTEVIDAGPQSNGFILLNVGH